jgi:hypothetical protein
MDQQKGLNGEGSVHVPQKVIEGTKKLSTFTAYITRICTCVLTSKWIRAKTRDGVIVMFL